MILLSSYKETFLIKILHYYQCILELLKGDLRKHLSSLPRICLSVDMHLTTSKAFCLATQLTFHPMFSRFLPLFVSPLKCESILCKLSSAQVIFLISLPFLRRKGVPTFQTLHRLPLVSRFCDDPSFASPWHRVCSVCSLKRNRAATTTTLLG